MLHGYIDVNFFEFLSHQLSSLFTFEVMTLSRFLSPGAASVPWVGQRGPESYDDLDDRTNHGEDQAVTGKTMMTMMSLMTRQIIEQIQI